MARYRQRRQKRYRDLIDNHFLPAEAREFSALPSQSPQLRLMVRERLDQWDRFVQRFDRYVDRGSWIPRSKSKRWKQYLTSWYRRNGFMTTGTKPVGKLRRVKHLPSPWAWYRSRERLSPGKNYVSPWEIQQLRRGKTPFDRGQIFVQKTKTKIKEDGGIGLNTLRSWIDQLEQSINRASKEDKDRFRQQQVNLLKLAQEKR